MNKDRFVAVIRDFCSRCGIADAMGIVHGQAVDVDGVSFSLVYSEQLDPRLLLICCDIAAVPPTGQKKVLTDLLVKNFYESASRGPVLGISPDTGRIVMNHTETLDGLTADGLVASLQNLSQYALTWREVPLFKGKPAGVSPQARAPRAVSASRFLNRQLPRS